MAEIQEPAAIPPQGMTWADLQPLTPAEVRRWVAARYDGVADQVTRWRYLNDPVYHARVEIWEQSRLREQP